MYTPRWSYASDPGFKYGFRLFGNGTTRALLGTPADPYYPCLARTHTHARIHARTHTCARTHTRSRTHKTNHGSAHARRSLILSGFSVTPTSAACNTHAFGGQATPALLPRTVVAQPAAHAASICAPGQDLGVTCRLRRTTVSGLMATSSCRCAPSVTALLSLQPDDQRTASTRPARHQLGRACRTMPSAPCCTGAGCSGVAWAVIEAGHAAGSRRVASVRMGCLLINTGAGKGRSARANGVGVVTVPVLDVAGL